MRATLFLWIAFILGLVGCNNGLEPVDDTDTDVDTGDTSDTSDTGDTSDTSDTGTQTYTVGGTLSGLIGTVVLQNSGGDDLSLTADGAFTFATALDDSTAFAVAVLTQPTNQTCTVTNGSGTVAGANVTNVSVSCAANTFTVGGTLTGLTGTVVLRNSGGDDLSLTADGAFTFATAIATGTNYNVTVFTPPAGQTCLVTRPAGTMGLAHVTDVKVECTTDTYTVGGDLSGLIGSITLQNNGGDYLTLTADGPFTFPTSLLQSAAYDVTVLTPPTGQTCLPTNNTGVIAGSSVTNVTVTCTSNTYTLGGDVSGLSGSLTLKNNGGDDLTLTTDGPFTFSAPVAFATAYNVAVSAQPAGQTCTVTNSSGAMAAANVTNLAVNCVSGAFSVGGDLSGLSGTVVLRNNGGDDLTLTVNGPFTFPATLVTTDPYAVTVYTQPAGQDCTVTAGSGTINAASVTDVVVTCTNNSYTVGGILTGLGDSITLQNNAGNDLTLTADGGFTFTTPVDFGSPYAVTVLTLPTNQDCSVTSGSGIMGPGPVSDVLVTCADAGLSCPGDDLNENNDIPGDATALSSTDSTEGIICSGDTDWYVVTVGDDCILDIDLTFVDAEGDLDVGLYDDYGWLVDLSISVTDDEFISYITSYAQDLYIEVSGGTGTENLYTLDLTTTCQTLPLTCPTDDFFEDNDTRGTATDLNLDYTALAGTVCPDDTDWYTGDLPPGCWFFGRFGFLHANGDLDADLVDAASGDFLNYSWSGTDNEYLSYHADPDATSSLSLALSVYGYMSAENDYDLTTWFTCPSGPPSCPADDMYEDNDTWDWGTELNALDPIEVYLGIPTATLTTIDAAVCGGDRDWYYMYVNEGCTLDAEVSFANASGNLEVALYQYDSWVTPLDTSATTADTESVSHTVLTGQTDLYFIEVYGNVGTESNTYRLDALASCP